MKDIKSGLAATLILGLSACASMQQPSKLPSTAVIIPRVSGLYEAVALAKTKQAAFRDALNGATNTCNDKRMAMVVKSDSTKFKGVLDESTNKIIADVTSVIKEYTGVSAPTLSHDDDFEVTLHFTCQPAPVIPQL